MKYNLQILLEFLKIKIVQLKYIWIQMAIFSIVLLLGYAFGIVIHIGIIFCCIGMIFLSLCLFNEIKIWIKKGWEQAKQNLKEKKND